MRTHSTHTHAHAHAHAHTHTSARTHTHAHTHTRTHTCIQAQTRTCAHTRTVAHTHTRTHTYSNIAPHHTLPSLLPPPPGYLYAHSGSDAVIQPITAWGVPGTTARPTGSEPGPGPLRVVRVHGGQQLRATCPLHTSSMPSSLAWVSPHGQLLFGTVAQARGLCWTTAYIGAAPSGERRWLGGGMAVVGGAGLGMWLGG